MKLNKMSETEKQEHKKALARERQRRYYQRHKNERHSYSKKYRDEHRETERSRLYEYWRRRIFADFGIDPATKKLAENR